MTAKGPAKSSALLTFGMLCLAVLVTVGFDYPNGCFEVRRICSDTDLMKSEQTFKRCRIGLAGFFGVGPKTCRQ